MTSDDADTVGEPLADLLAALDERLAAGDGPPAGADPDLPPDQLQLFHWARDGLLSLERAFPRSAPAGDEPAPSFDPLTGAGRLGKFRLHRELGRGGSGIVFLATDTAAGRDVALKLPRLEALLDPGLRARFLGEARLTVGLDHPGLVPVYEAGEVEAVCYIASAYGGDVTLESWLESRVEHAPVRTAAALVAALARGVDYLHGHQVLHRDIKPSNVLLGPAPAGALPDPELAACGVPKLTDFGLAKLLDATAPAGGTTVGVVLGTAEYMAPEQADGRPELLGRWTDVYALGAVLYELLTGQPPFRGRNKFDTVRKLLTEEPAPVRRHRKGVPRDLESVCLKCLEKAPRRRYATAGQLADDLQRCLGGERPLARPAPWWRRAWKWARRRPAAAALFAAAAMAVPTAAATWFGIHTYRLSVRAEQSRRLDAALEARRRGVELCGQGDVGAGLLWLARALADAPPGADDLRDLVRLDLDAWRARTPVVSAVLPHPAKVHAVQFSPDGQTAVTLCHDNLVRLWEAGTGRRLDPPLAHPKMSYHAEFSADGRQVRTMCADGYFRTWSVATRELVRTDPARCTEGAPQGDRANWTGDLLWEFRLGQPPTRRVKEDVGAIWLLHPFPGGRQVLTLSFGSVARVWGAGDDTAGGVLPHGGAVHDAALSPDGACAATAGVTAAGDRCVRFWDPETRRELSPPLVHPSPVHAVAFAPAGGGLATGDTDTLRVWDAVTRTLRHAVPRQGQVVAVTFSPDGTRLASANADYVVRLFRLPPPPPAPFVHPLAGTPPGPAADTAERRRRSVDGIMSVAVHPDGRRVFAAGGDAGVRTWDARTGRCTGLSFRHADAVTRLAVHPSGRTLLTGGRDGSARVWDVETGRETINAMPHHYEVGGAVIDPGGVLAATAALRAGPVRVWDAVGGRPMVEFGPIGAVHALAFRPDGGEVVAACQEGAYVYDRTSGRTRALPHPSPVFAAAYHPSGRWFVTGTRDGELRWWDADSLECAAVVPAHASRLKHAAFSPNGDVLATVGGDERLVFWHPRTRQPVGPPVLLGSAGLAVAFHPDGAAAVAGCRDYRVHTARAPAVLAGTPRKLLLWAQAATGLELGANDMPRPLNPAAWRDCRAALGAEGGPPD